MGYVDGDFDAPPPGRMGWGSPRVRLGAIGEALDLLLARLGTWVLAMLVVLLGYAIVYAISTALLGPAFDVTYWRGFPVLVPRLPRGPGALLGLVGMVANGYFLGGLFRMACRQLRGQEFGPGDLLAVSDLLPSLALGSVLYGVGVAIGALFCLVPGVVLSSVWMFTLPLIVDARLPATQALGQSYRALKGQWLSVTAFHVVLLGLMSLGYTLCCVGALFTAPLYALAVGVLYRDFFGSKLPGS